MTTNDPAAELEVEEAPIFQNANYEVAIMYIGEDADPYVDGKYAYRTTYCVINRNTEVIEHVCVQLPEAIFTAVGLDAALEKAPWNWKDHTPAPAPVVN